MRFHGVIYVYLSYFPLNGFILQWKQDPIFSRNSTHASIQLVCTQFLASETWSLALFDNKAIEQKPENKNHL